MKNFLSKNSDIGILILRIGVGTGFLFVHGWNKIMQGPELWAKLGKVMPDFGIAHVHVIWGFMASLAEFGGGILLIFGLFTRSASSFLAFTMIVAAFQHLSKMDPWNRVIYPVEMFSAMMLIVFIGAGKYSLDHLFFHKNKTLYETSAAET